MSNIHPSSNSTIINNLQTTSSNSIKTSINHTITKTTQTSRVQNNQTFQCHHQDCLRLFTRKTSLTNHLKAHQNARSRSIYRTKRARQRAEEQRRAAATAAAVARMQTEEEQQSNHNISTTTQVRYSYQSLPDNVQQLSKNAPLPPLQLSTLPSVISNTTQQPSAFPCLPSSNEVINQDIDILHSSNNIIADNLRIEPLGSGTSPVSTNEAAYLTTNANHGEQQEISLNLLENRVELGHSLAESSSAPQSKVETQAPIPTGDNMEDDMMIQAISKPYPYLDVPSLSECPGSLLHQLGFNDIGTIASVPTVELTNSSQYPSSSNLEPQRSNNKNDDEEFFEEVGPLTVDFLGRVRPVQEIVDEICMYNAYEYGGIIPFS